MCLADRYKTIYIRILLADRKNEEVDPREEMYKEMYGEQTDKKSKRRKK